MLPYTKEKAGSERSWINDTMATNKMRSQWSSQNIKEKKKDGKKGLLVEREKGLLAQLVCVGWTFGLNHLDWLIE